MVILTILIVIDEYIMKIKLYFTFKSQGKRREELYLTVGDLGGILTAENI